jgi:ribulose-phosphate 3-epimerase
MDGQFVPNLTIGPSIVQAIREHTTAAIDAHLMTINPERLIPEFAAAGANVITVHQEACTHLHRTVHQIKDLGVRAGVAINPGTSISTLEEIIADIDLLLIMTVNPGFGGQQFIEGMSHKINRARSMIDRTVPSVELEVDGGINPTNVGAVIEAGATVIVAGSAIYGGERTISECVASLKAAIAHA